MKIPQLVYLNPKLVEENWSLIKGDGIEESRIKEIDTKLKTGIKFGLGNLISSFIADIKSSTSLSVEKKSNSTIKYPDSIKLFFLKQIIPELKDLGYEVYEDFFDVKIGEFVDIRLPKLFFHQIPTRSEMFSLEILESIKLNDEDINIDLNSITNYISSISALSSSIQFSEYINSKDNLPDVKQSPLKNIYEEYNEEFENLLNLSENDSVVGVTRINHINQLTFFMINMEKEYLRKNIANYLSNQEFHVFGRICTHKIKKDETFDKTSTFIGIDPIAITIEE